MKTLQERLVDTQTAAEARVKGTPLTAADGTLVDGPTTSALAALFIVQRETITGQKVAPPSGLWRMSNNSLSKRVDPLEAFVLTVPGLIADAVAETLTTVQGLLQLQAEQFSLLLQAQADQHAIQLADQRTVIENELTSGLAPLVAGYNALKSEVQADEQSDQSIHAQLLTTVGTLSGQVGTVASQVTTLTTNQTTFATSLTTLQNTVGVQATDITNLKQADSTFSSQLTTLNTKLTTTTTTANSAQDAAGKNTTDITALKLVDAGLRTDVDAAKTQADKGVTNAATAQTQANSAVTAASSAQTAATNAGTAAATAQTTANTGVANAATAQTTANNAATAASTAQTTANSAKTTADGLVTSVGNLTTTVNQNTTDITKRLRNDQNDGTAFNLVVKAATDGTQAPRYSQVPQTRSVVVSSPAMLLGASTTVVATWPTAFADTSYVVAAPSLSPSIAGLQVTVSNKTTTTCTLTLKNTLGLALLQGAGTLDVTAIHL